MLKRKWQDKYPALVRVLAGRGGPVHTVLALNNTIPLAWAKPGEWLMTATLSDLRASDLAIQAGGVKLVVLKRELKAYREEATARREARSVAQSANHSRLYPLADYDAFARQVWERRGKPRFHKQKIHGVRWGSGELETNGKTGWDCYIISRFLGCSIQGARIVITCPD